MILYCTLSSAINCLASLALALAVFLRRPRTATSVTFGWFAVSVTLWSMAYLLWQLAADRGAALFYSRLLTAAAIIVPVAYFHCVFCLLGLRRGPVVWLSYAGALVFSGLAFTPLLIKGIAPKPPFPFWPQPGVLYALYLAFFAVYVVASLTMLVRGFRAADGLQRNQLRLVTIGTAIGFLGGSTNFFLWYDIPIPPVGNGLVTIYVVAVGYAIIRFRLMEVNLLAARLAAYTALIGILSLVTPAIVAAIGRLPLAEGYSISLVPVLIASFFATAAAFILTPALRRRVDAFLERRVLGNRLADRALLRGLASKISSATDENALMLEVVHSLADALNAAEVAVYTRTEFETDFTRRAATGGSLPADLPQFQQNSPLVQALQAAGRGLILDEEVHAAADELRNYFSALRRKQHMVVAVPIIGDTIFYGFLTLGSRADQALYNDVDVSLVETIGLQIGLNLRARQLERRASQTEKLISLGTLAAGLAHELRNPLVSIQTFSALLKERGTELDFQQEFSAVVQRDVSRIASIVENVAAFAESNKVQMTAVNLSEVLRAAAEIVRPELVRTNVELVLPAAEVARVTANYSQLLQVFLNLMQNSVQAMEGRPGSRLAVSFELRPGAPQPLLCVSLTDNGPGIDPALLPHVFEPFTTTKSTGARLGKHGMGLGLAIVKRIIQNHHGEINVTSTVDQGTTFRVYLPQLI